MTFDIVPDEMAEFSAGFLGETTPLAQAIIGEFTGATIPYFVDDLKAVHILSVSVSKRVQDKDTGVRREANIREAVSQIEFTNAVLFASSADTKWGDYDADGLDYNKWKPKSSQDDGENLQQE
jgi:hypothetical protein